MKVIKNVGKCLVMNFGLILAVAGFFWLANSSSAMEKGGATLMKLNAIKTVDDVQHLEPGDMVVMACPKCKDVTISVIDPSARVGMKPEVKQLQKHMCPGCAEVFSTEGHGKLKTDKVTHVCKQCGSTDAFCCVKKKGAKATEGMEEKK